MNYNLFREKADIQSNISDESQIKANKQIGTSYPQEQLGSQLEEEIKIIMKNKPGEGEGECI